MKATANFMQVFKQMTTNTKNLLKDLALSLRVHAMIAAVLAINFLILMIKRPDFFWDDEKEYPLLLILFLCGMLGGVINNYLRINKLPSSHLDKFVPKEKIINILQIYVSLLVSGTLGLIFYAAISSGLIQGSFFPEFVNLDAAYSGTFSNFFQQVLPKTNHDVLKAIIWCFVAGFSEKLVPNTIDKLASKAELTITQRIDEIKVSNKKLEEDLEKENKSKEELLSQIAELKQEINSENKNKTDT